jgi:soluble lytic murein transglycosylase-like protein
LRDKKRTIAAGMVLAAFLLSGNTCFAKEPAHFITDEDLSVMTKEVGDLYGISPYLLEAICERESSQDANAENSGCLGLTQISLRWHSDRMEKLGVTDLYDPYSNLLVCADYLSELYDIAETKGYGDDTYYVLMRYNMSTSKADKLYKAGEITKYARDVYENACRKEEDAKALGIFAQSEEEKGRGY